MAQQSELKTLAKKVFTKQWPALSTKGPVSASDMVWGQAGSDPSFNWKRFNVLMKELADLMGTATPYTKIASRKELSEAAQVLDLYT